MAFSKMTTEREMLEYAANACGCELDWYPSTRCDLVTKRSVGEVVKLDWNPLTNSADCAAMCAKLRIDTLWTDDCVVCGDDSRTYESEIPLDDDPEAAWRYAATMVAAKIGGMK